MASRQVRDVTGALETLAPLAGAESWDNVGLLIGGPDWPARRVLLTIDLTDAVLEEAITARTQMIVAYHPPIFEPLRALGDTRPNERIALGAARASIAVYSPHTALDAAPGGVNDWLAGGVGPGEVRALTPGESLPATETRKIVTFCPRASVDAIRGALSVAGAGQIGAYESCSFELEGTGTFLGGPGTSPAVGARGKLERVSEVRLEMVCAQTVLGPAVATLREHHPYEEPPIEIYALQPRPHEGRGAGRRVVLSEKQTLPDLATRIKRRLGVRSLRVAPGRAAPRRYTTIGLCPGAGGSLAGDAIDQGCELYLTGEMRHHDVLAAQARSCTIILAGHTNTERGFLKPLGRTLARRLPDLDVRISRRDRDPLKSV